MVNGPEDEALDWHQVDWAKVEDEVRRLRQRTFTASQVGDLKKVRSLQRLMLRSRANALLSVRRVTEVNAGRKTAGVDGKVVVTAPGKAALADRVRRLGLTGVAQPVRRVYIPKKGNGKQRPLGIPVIFDRARQAQVKSALEPEWEARFEPKSYGFRRGRGCHDAIEAIFHVARGPNPSRRWILDADLAAAFDRIDHSHLLDQLGTFPAREQVRAWLKAGVVEQGRLAPSEEGTPQGGVVSPVLLNIALHGMEQAAGVRYQQHGVHAGELRRDSPVLIRYADDLLALCHTRQQAEQVKERLAGWLTLRGLAFNEDKTRIVSLDDGCDFLGFNVRRQSGKLLVKPSKEALRRHRQRLRSEMRSLRGHNAVEVLQRLTPIVRGWATYYRTVISSELFSALDRYLWKLTYKWAKQAHPKKAKRWVVNRYFARFNRSRNDRWVFGDRNSGAYLVKHAWTRIVRHQMVKAGSSPDDPALAEYWANRRRKTPPPPMDGLSLRLLQTQKGTCPLCGELLLAADRPPQSPHEWEQWVRTTGKALTKRSIARQEQGASGSNTMLRLVHTRCHRRPRTNEAAADQALLLQRPRATGLA